MAWKSDNQGDKEETFIQTGRRGGDGQLGKEGSWQGGGWWTVWARKQLVEQAVPHMCADQPGGINGE